MAMDLAKEIDLQVSAEVTVYLVPVHVANGRLGVLLPLR